MKKILYPGGLNVLLLFVKAKVWAEQEHVQSSLAMAYHGPKFDRFARHMHTSTSGKLPYQVPKQCARLTPTLRYLICFAKCCDHEIISNTMHTHTLPHMTQLAFASTARLRLRAFGAQPPSESSEIVSKLSTYMFILEAGFTDWFHRFLAADGRSETGEMAMERSQWDASDECLKYVLKGQT